MRNAVKNILILLLIVIFAYLFRGEILLAWKQIKGKYFPCRDPIAYSIGEFDERFGISREEFVSSLQLAENIWEKPIDKDFFQYKEGSLLKINLIYDSRQEATKELSVIDKELDSDKATYNEIKAKYESLKSSYNRQRVSFETRVKVFEARKAAYEKEVENWNTKGGAPKETYNELEKEKEWINNEAAMLNQIQNELNRDVSRINNLAVTLNRLATDLNLNVEKFNEIGGMHGEEFEEGNYERDQNGERINIYQFENKGKLVRVLAHEFGHALGLDHVEEKEAIMYRLNNGINQDLAESDINALKLKCQL